MLILVVDIGLIKVFKMIKYNRNMMIVIDWGFDNRWCEIGVLLFIRYLFVKLGLM